MKRRLLIVDDDAATRLLLERHFTARGFACQVASDGQTALALLQAGQIHVMITDLQMPGMDGIALLRSVRMLDLLTRCVVITGYVTISNLTACLREGAVALIPKPLNELAPLEQAVDQAFAQMQRWKDDMSAIIRLRPPSATASGTDHAR